MQDGVPKADEAGEWLKRNAGSGISITLVPTKPNPAVYREIQEILFGPEEVTQAT